MALNWQLYFLVSAFKFLLVPAYRSTDFEVHRNWLAITHSLPISQWYFEATSEWTLDYPPFFAWFEYALSWPATLVDPKMLVVANLNYASWATIVFQRATVIITDLVLFYGISKFTDVRHYPRKPSEKETFQKFGDRCTIILTMLNPGLVIVDHVHFQYNGFLMGLLLLFLVEIYQGRDIRAGAIFAALLMFKHIFLYMLPVVFVYLLRHHCWAFETKFERRVDPVTGTSRKRVVDVSPAEFYVSRFVKLGVAVLTVFGIALAPFASKEQLVQLLSRLFPFQRGLMHAYWAPNFWALYSIADKITEKALGKVATGPSLFQGLVGTTPKYTVLPAVNSVVTLNVIALTLMPLLLYVWTAARPRKFILSLVMSSLLFFMFGYHVHEKAILMALVPLGAVATETRLTARLYLLLAVPGYTSLFPLLFESREGPLKVALVAGHLLLAYVILTSMFKQARMQPRPKLLAAREIAYISAAPCIVVLASFIVPRAFPRHTFLPLLIYSIYCAIGVTYMTLLLAYAIGRDYFNTVNLLSQHKDQMRHSRDRLRSQQRAGVSTASSSTSTSDASKLTATSSTSTSTSGGKKKAKATGKTASVGTST